MLPEDDDEVEVADALNEDHVAVAADVTDNEIIEVIVDQSSMESDDEAGDSDDDDFSLETAEKKICEPPKNLDYKLYEKEIEQIEETMVTLFGKEQPFKDVLNVPLRDLAMEIAVVEEVRSKIILSAEQTNKTMMAVGIMKAAHVMRKPTAMFVMDLKRSIESLCHTKVDAALRPFGIEAINPSGKAGFRALSRNAAKMEKFRNGQLVLIMQPLQNNISLFFENIVLKHDIHDMVTILDEADAMWSSAVDIQNGWVRAQVTARERQMYRLLAGPFSSDNMSLFQSNRVRCLFSVSATHMATLEWHSQWRAPYKSYVVDLDMLKERGFSVYDSLDLLKDSTGTNIFLDPGMQTKRQDYNIRSRPVRRIMEVFYEDMKDVYRADTKTGKKGLLMMVAMSPRINANGMNAHVISEHLLQSLRDMRDQDAAGAGSSTGPAGQGKEPVAIVICNDGPWLVQLKPDGEGVCKTKLRKKVRCSKTRRWTIRRMTSEEAIAFVDKEFKLDTPLLLVGFGCMKRGLSLRSHRRAITHLMVGPTRGMAAANVQQMTMRCGGSTTTTREDNGFSGVTVLMIEEDYQLVKNLYKFTSDALRSSATGRLEDVDAWKTKSYARHFACVLQAPRPQCTGRMGQQVGLSLVNASLLPIEEAGRTGQQVGHSLVNASILPIEEEELEADEEDMDGKEDGVEMQEDTVDGATEGTRPTRTMMLQRLEALVREQVTTDAHWATRLEDVVENLSASELQPTLDGAFPKLQQTCGAFGFSQEFYLLGVALAELRWATGKRDKEAYDAAFQEDMSSAEKAAMVIRYYIVLRQKSIIIDRLMEQGLLVPNKRGPRSLTAHGWVHVHGLVQKTVSA